jgi:uncharacterized membrane protein
MTRHWLIAGLIGLLLGGVAYAMAIRATPGILMSSAVGRVAKAAGMNAMFFGPLATDEARTIVRPSPDLAYSSCPFDVSKGPVLIDAMPVAAPYWSLSVFDAKTDVAFVRNNAQAGGRPIKVAVLKAGMTAPAGYEPVPVEGDKGVALIRILVADRSAFGALDAARRTSRCAPVTPAG